MQFIVKAYDGEGMLEKRMEVRPRHLEGMNKLREHIVVAGGLLDEAGKMKGSMLVMDFDSRSELDDYIANEPYVLENVWQKIEVEVINVVLAKGEPYKK
ncbi:MAG: YciI family protein [Lachnospiraceae bacterium]|nr:YciI family protein [Lachnospiraceae bacterium]